MSRIHEIQILKVRKSNQCLLWMTIKNIAYLECLHFCPSTSDKKKTLSVTSHQGKKQIKKSFSLLAKIKNRRRKTTSCFPYLQNPIFLTTNNIHKRYITEDSKIQNIMIQQKSSWWCTKCLVVYLYTQKTLLNVKY